MGQAAGFSLTAPPRQCRSVFDLSHEVKGTGDMGILYPILVKDALPGDVWSLQFSTLVRFHQSLFAPLLHNVKVQIHVFQVPKRIMLGHGGRVYVVDPEEDEQEVNDIWAKTMAYTTVSNSWEQYITGGKAGPNTSGSTGFTIPESTIMQRVSTSGYKKRGGACDWLYGVAWTQEMYHVNAWPEIAYLRIWNDFYRDKDLQKPATWSPDTEGRWRAGDTDDGYLLRRNWQRDYFTSARPWRQRGAAAAIPASLGGSATFIGDQTVAFQDLNIYGSTAGNATFSATADQLATVGARLVDANGEMGRPGFVSGPSGSIKLADWLNQNNIVYNNSFTINDLRDVFQMTMWMERNARIGSRYAEHLLGRFGVKPQDHRLNRPEYMGGFSAPVIFSEVLKTTGDKHDFDDPSNTHDPQGNLAGHGISGSRSGRIKFRVHEHGIIMAMLSIMPDTNYDQGVSREWLRNSFWEEFFPEFVTLGEQPIFEREIWGQADSWSNPREIFGYQGRYDEYRYQTDKVHGEIRGNEPNVDYSGNLPYWTMVRHFSTETESRPHLNDMFVTCRPTKGIYPVGSEPGLLFQTGIRCKVARPLPAIAKPGLIDHH